MDVHVYLHFGADLSAELRAILALVTQMNATVQQVKDDVATLKTEVTALTTVKDSAISAFQGLAAIIASLKQQLADALANATGLSAEDKAALQDVHDGLGQLATEVGSDKSSIATAITTNVPPA